MYANTQSKLSKVSTALCVVTMAVAGGRAFYGQHTTGHFIDQARGACYAVRGCEPTVIPQADGISRVELHAKSPAVEAQTRKSLVQFVGSDTHGLARSQLWLRNGVEIAFITEPEPTPPQKSRKGETR